jgi:S1-C subfamily serine protease
MAIDQQPQARGPVLDPPYAWSPPAGAGFETPPPAPPWSGAGGYAAPRPEPPRRRWLFPLVAGAAIVALAVAGGTALAVVTADRTPKSVAAPLVGSSNAYPGYPFGGNSGRGSNSQQVPSQTGNTPADPAITSAVDPTIVDINTTLGLQQAAAAGTGIVLTASGEVLTNNHVIDGATAITATDVGTGQTYQATVVGYDRTRDLAVIQFQGASNLPTASLGDVSTVATGASITAIGNAGGAGGTPSAVTGTVVALNQSITASDQGGGNAEQLAGLIQIAAPIQPGDSGGPLVDSGGKVIGMDTAADNSGAGFAIPIDQATAVAAQIEAGTASDTVHIGATAFLGIAVAATSTSNAATTSGVAVSDVVSGSPAEQAGLGNGDTLLTLDGTTLSRPTTLTSLLTAHHPGDRVTLTVADSTGQTRTVTLTLTTGPAA